MRRLRRQATGGDAGEEPRRKAVQHYLDSHPVRKVQLGSGATNLDGWLCTDLEPKRPDVLRVDATKRFPFPDDSLDFIAAEHVIEHMSYPRGQKLLHQCLRTLRPGGTVRIATPHLRRLAEMYLGQAGAEGELFKTWSLKRYHEGRRYAHGDQAAFVLNHHMRAWGHTFLYDDQVLRNAFAEAGFEALTECAFGGSSHPELCDIERHGAQWGKRMRRAVRFETLVIEGTKPSVGRPVAVSDR
jgi:predicted SAM-dependent methyltransferase